MKKVIILCFVLYTISLFGQTIAEKKSSLSGGGADLAPETIQFLNYYNQQRTEISQSLRHLYRQAATLSPKERQTDTFAQLIQDIKTKKMQLKALDEEWIHTAKKGTENERYALWQQPDTTIEQLIIDYGTADSVYLMPIEVGAIKISINSNIPIPRSSWNEMLDLILTQNGIGIKELNPYLKELYLIQNSTARVSVITNNPNDLEFYPPQERIAFILSPDPSNVRRTLLFLSKFINEKSTKLEALGRDILIIATSSELQELLKLYAFASGNGNGKEHRLMPLNRIKAQEMAKILHSVFDQMPENSSTKEKNSANSLFDSNSLKIIVLEELGHALFLIGTKEELHKAEMLIKEVENRISGPKEKVVYWYTAKYSDPEELAGTLSQIYTMLVEQAVLQGPPGNGKEIDLNIVTNNQDTTNSNSLRSYDEPFYESGNPIINPKPIGYTEEKHDENSYERNQDHPNFIVDPKSGSIVLVVEKDLLEQMQEIIARLDVPKKMVHIEVLLVEKQITDNKIYGLNLLRLGDAASQMDKTSLQFRDSQNPLRSTLDGTSLIANTISGILDFTIQRPKDGFPAFDAIYRFLLTRDDVQINSNPSALALNQTPVTLRVMEEISINNGTQIIPQGGDNVNRLSFTRAQYGINMIITPTVHMGKDRAEGDSLNYVTLKTEIGFDTIGSSFTDRPPITRRQIINEVTIPDGQTVIIGGLRDQNLQDSSQKIPFLGEIPGIGKLFSNTSTADRTKEMFLFITPKIISDPCEDLEEIKRENMVRRPGDIPDFLYCLQQARKHEKERLFSGSMEMLLGRPAAPCFKTYVPCDGEDWKEQEWETYEF